MIAWEANPFSTNTFRRLVQIVLYFMVHGLGGFGAGAEELGNSSPTMDLVNSTL